MRARLTVGELATLGERCLGGATPSPLMERAVADLVADRVAEIAARVESVLAATEWNDWPGRHRLRSRIRAALTGRRV